MCSRVRDPSLLTHRLGLEGLDGLDVSANIVCHGLVLLQDFFCLIDDGLVLQHGAVVREVDGGGLSLKLSVYSLGVSVTLAEGLEGSDSLCNCKDCSISKSLRTG